jgi:hypothetical protein
MKLPHFFGEICAQRYGNQQICHAVASATRVNQGVGLCVLQQPLARHREKASNPQKRTNFTVTQGVATADMDGNAVASVARRFSARAHSRS